MLQFRIRTMITVTTALAVSAAIAGTYYRSVESEAARNKLLLAWAFLLVSAALCFGLRVREAWRRPEECEVRYIVYARGRRRRGKRSTFWSALSCVGLGMWIAAGSYGIVLSEEAPRRPTTFLPNVFRSPLGNVGIMGIWTSALIFSFVRRPMFVCEEGIPLGKKYVAPWKYIRHAEWQTDRPETLKLHRLDGDIYLDVPNEVRGEVEAFVRGKTLFIDDVVAVPPV
ncbi:MAG: hypothetical protein C0485_18620 [Pirellula sp.]|nr:hypothetical protein [Pirellula sp.]